jgi:hypothetical protein
MVHAATGMSANYLELGYMPKLPIQNVFARTVLVEDHTSVRFMQQWQDALFQAQKSIETYQIGMKAAYDKNHRQYTFKVGDEVKINLNSTRFANLRTAGVTGFGPKWLGPFPIVEQVTPVTFKLNVPSNITKNPMFHVSQLHEWVRRDPHRFPNDVGFDNPPPIGIVDGQAIYKISAIKKHKYKSGNSPGSTGPVTYEWSVVLTGYPSHLGRELLTPDLLKWVNVNEAEHLIGTYIEHLRTPTRLQGTRAPEHIRKLLYLWDNQRARVIPGWRPIPDLNAPSYIGTGAGPSTQW